MEKVKIKTGLASLIVVATMFAGWQAMLIALVLLLLFCELDEKVKTIMVKVVAFAAGLALVGLFWDIITSGVSALLNTLTDFISLINSYLDPVNKINTSDFQQYVINPINIIVKMADRIVTLLFLIFKVLFVLAILSGKDTNGKFNLFIKRFINFEKNVENPNFGVNNTPNYNGPYNGPNNGPMGPMGPQPGPNFNNNMPQR